MASAIQSLTFGAEPAMELLSTATASSDATIDFTTAGWFDGTYSALKVEGSNIVPATDAATLGARIRIGGTWQTSGSYHYTRTGVNTSNSTATAAGSAGTSMQILVTIGNASGENGSFEFRLPDPTNTTEYKMLRSWGTVLASNGLTYSQDCSGAWVGATSAIDGLRFLFSSGNVASGTFKLYGLR